MFLATIETGRIKEPAIRGRLVELQRDAAGALDRWFRGPQPAPAPALRFEVGNGDALEVAQYLITAMKTDRQRVDQIADRQTTQETALASNAAKTEQLSAKVDALAAKRSRILTGEVHTSAVKVAGELGIQALTFARFVKARPAMRQLQRADGRWPLDRTVATYKEIIADPNAPVLAEEERVIRSPFGLHIANYIRAFCGGRLMTSDEHRDTWNLVYDRFAKRAGYDPRAMATNRVSALDVVQRNGHLDILMQVAHEVCPMDGVAVGNA